ncbi:hypothetical protein [Pseudoalteromonas phenolica]|jgi:protein involved in sex pheromone biosynthesis|uniref:hypothetical protein n=1 Tax=Pseudoalteromonas phenolica TaxID=161398 RepID=UPI003850C7F3
MKKISLLLFGLTFIISGCSNTVDRKTKMNNQLAAVENNDNYICKTVKKTGSNFNTRRCMTKEAYKRSKEAAQEALIRLGRTYTEGGTN